MALAVKAMIGRRRSSDFDGSLDGLVAIHFGHHDVHQDDGDVRRRLDQRHRFCAGGGGEHLHAAAFERCSKREDVAHIVVHHEHGRPTRSSSERWNRSSMCCFSGGRSENDAVQEERGLVQQALGRFHAFDDDAARDGVQPRVLVGRQFLAGEDHDWHVGERRLARMPLQHLEPGHVRQAQIQHHAIAGLFGTWLSAAPPVPAVTISMSSCPSNSRMLIRSAALSSTISSRLRRGRYRLDAGQRLVESLARGRLVDERKRSARQAVLSIFVEWSAIWTGTCLRRPGLVELAQDLPAEHVGQEHVERDGGRMILRGEVERLAAATATSTLKPLSRARSIERRA